MEGGRWIFAEERNASRSLRGGGRGEERKWKLAGFFHGPRRAVKFGLNGHSTRVRGKTWLSLSSFPSRCCCGRWRWGRGEEGGESSKGRGEAGTKVLGAERRGRRWRRRIREAVRNILTYITGEIGTRVCRRESLLPRHFPPPPCSSTPRLANRRRLRCPTARSDSPLSTPSSFHPATCLSVLLTTPVTQW